MGREEQVSAVITYTAGDNDLMDAEDLRNSLEAVEYSINHSLTNRVTKPYKDCKNFGNRLWAMIGSYRVRGILKFLIDADAQSFSEDMNREALTYLTFLQAYRAKLDIPEDRIDGSTYSPITSALATGNFQLASNISELMPRAFGENDGEELFAFTSMIRALVEGSPNQVEANFERFVESCSQSGDYDGAIEVARGLKDGSEKLFNDGLKSYLKGRDEIGPDEAEELRPGEDSLSVEGLAFTQLAKKRGLNVRIKHRLIPIQLQRATPIVPSSGYPSWPG